MRALLWAQTIVLALVGTAHADLTVTVTTTPNGGPYAPKNIVAIWVEGSGGTFVKTIDRHAGVRKDHLVAWEQKAGTNDVDAVTSATRQDHAQPITLTWNLRDKTGALVPDGTYTIRMELADSNANQASQNHQGTFTFVKSDAPQQQTGLSNGGFLNVSIDFQPVADTCNNGAVEAGETCDPALAGSCPTTCTPATDACMPNVLVGSAATCSAECKVQPITACADGDGCCPDGCDGMDSDCAGGGGGGTGEGADINGGCSTGSGAGGLAFAALALVLVRRRR
ncbi:MAG TPA: DUF2271 domain-containing protein [Kofleriaceae bacterium]|nr:DUF2271 domain-containing protein [Kofleriaceae bacterium]